MRTRAMNIRNRRYRLLLNDSGAPSDPFWSDVVLALDFEGDNNDTSTTDSSDLNNTITPVGTPIIITSDFKNGASATTTSVNAEDHWNCGNAAEYDPGSGDFTYEIWFKTPSTITSGKIIAGQWNGAHSTRRWCFYIGAANVPQFIYSTGASSPITNMGGALSADTWYHLAASREGTAIRLFVNGVYGGVATTAAALNPNNTADMTVGNADTGTSGTLGIIDMFRVTIGSSRYNDTGGFTPPTSLSDAP